MVLLDLLPGFSFDHCPALRTKVIGELDSAAFSSLLWFFAFMATYMLVCLAK